MKTVTLHVPEETYQAFQSEAKKTSCSTASLIRKAMESWQQEHIEKTHSLADCPEPAHIGKVLERWESRADLLDDMLG